MKTATELVNEWHAASDVDRVLMLARDVLGDESHVADANDAFFADIKGKAQAIANAQRLDFDAHVSAIANGDEETVAHEMGASWVVCMLATQSYDDEFAV